MLNRKFLLIGGTGFLGNGLQKQLIENHIDFKVCDIPDYDMTTMSLENIKQFFCDDWHVTDIVILASKIGAKLFNTSPAQASIDNMKILLNCIDLIRYISHYFNQSIDVTWYSTSEVYGSSDNCQEVSIDYFDSRSLYSQCKMFGETLFRELVYKESDVFQSIKIIRPFNVSGRNQKRGVVYDMIKSAIDNQTILYSRDSIRTLTDIDYASKMTIDNLLNNKDKISYLNLIDNDMTFTMKALAQYIRHVLSIHKLVEVNKLVDIGVDEHIQTRKFKNSKVIMEDMPIDINSSEYKKIEKIVLELYDQITNEH